jgi:phosphoglycolate phosphatase
LVNVEAVLGHVLLQRFTTIECGSALFGKARRLHRILQRTHICNENAIYVGDEIRDADAARKIGIRFGAVAWGYTELQALISMQPAAIFKTPADLVNLV